MIETLPDARIYLDDGTGTYPLEVTDRVQLASLDVSSHGRTDEFSEATAATLTVTLENDDGTFTSGVGFDTEGFDEDPFGGTVPVYPGLGIQYTVTVGATTAYRFTGRLTAIPLGWSAEPGLPSSVTLTAVDPLGSLSRRQLRSMLEEEILLRHPTAYYTLGEAEGSSAAGDSSGNGSAVLAETGSGAPVTFGDGAGPSDGMTTATFAAGQTLANDLTPGSSYSELVFFSRSGAPAVTEVLLATAHEFLVLETNGKVSLYENIGVLGFSLITPVAQSSKSLCDGGVHLAGWSVQYSVGYQLYLDGATTTVSDATAGTSSPIVSGLSVGGCGVASVPSTFVPPLTGNVSHVAHFDGTVLSSLDVSQIWSVISGTETTLQRHSRICTYAGLPHDAVGTPGRTVGPQDTSGSSALDALQAVAAAEGGVVYANGAGVIVLQSADYRAKKTTANLTLSADDIDVGTTVSLDDQQIVNQVTVSRTNGATQTFPSDADLVGVERYPQSLDLIVDSDTAALQAAQWLVTKHSEASPRIPSASIDLMRCPQTEQVIASKVGDRWALTDLPPQMWAVSGDQTVEGWTETLTVNGAAASWTLTVNLLPWSLETAFILDDPTYGALDAFPIMN